MAERPRGAGHHVLGSVGDTCGAGGDPRGIAGMLFFTQDPNLAGGMIRDEEIALGVFAE